MERRDMLKGAIAAASAYSAQDKASGEIKDAQYVVAELMGYKKLAGRLSQGPAGLLRLDVAVDGGFVTQLINPASFYRITVVDEQTCREYAKSAADPLPAIELEMPMRQRTLGYDEDEPW